MNGGALAGRSGAGGVQTVDRQTESMAPEEMS